MANKNENKFLDRLIKKADEEMREVENQVSMFYEDGERAEITSTPDKDPFAGILLAMRKNPVQQPLTNNEMLEKCFEIRTNVKQCKPDNLELNFIEGVQRFKGNSHELGNTVIKVIAKDADTPAYLHIQKGDMLSSLVFIGGDDALAFLVTRDADGKDFAIRLAEFHLLSISEKSKPEEEIGLLTSYSWMGAQVHTSVVIGMSLNPIKNLLLSEGLRNINTGTQRTNEIAKKTTHE